MLRLSRVPAGREQLQPSVAMILPGQAKLVVRFPRFAACRMVRMLPVASADCSVGTASVCSRPLSPQCLRSWLCIAGRCSGPPAASADLYVMQQAKKRLKSGFRCGDRHDRSAHCAVTSSESGASRTVPASGRRDLAGLGQAARTLFLVRWRPAEEQRACRLSRAPRGYSFGMLSATSTAVPSTWLCITGRSSRSPAAPAQLQR